MALCVIFCTAADEATANNLASALVEHRAAACVKVVGNVSSFYRWQGKVENDSEYQLIIKTSQDRVDAAKALVDKLHPYDVPEWVVLPDVSGSEAYQSWVIEQTREQ